MTDEIREIDITEIGGFRIGHAQNDEAATGCTVIVCEKGAVTGVDVRGGSPGTRDTDALNPVNNRKVGHAVVLSGGSSFGLDAVGGVLRYLEERGIGRDVGVTCVPNVSGAILFDLKCGNTRIRPDAAMGYEACVSAFSLPPVFGSVGAGTGATVGKCLGMRNAMKGGIGRAALRYGRLHVGAVVAVNCVGDVLDAESGRVLAGVLNADGRTIGSSEALILRDYATDKDFFSGNTVIGCVITNARLEKSQATKLASVSQNGIARAIRPAHSIYDGDTLFTMCTGEISASPDAVAILAVKAVSRAIADAIISAQSLCGYPSFQTLNT